MLNTLKRILLLLLSSVLLLAAVFLFGRYGWRLWGFRACQGAGIEAVEVSDTEVRIKGFYPGSFPEGFCGCHTREQDGTLYVGFRFSAVFGVFETGDFAVALPVKGPIDRVVMKGSVVESTLWTNASAGEAQDVPAP